jgi:hypothetical protein
VHPEAKLARAPGEDAARCTSFWTASPPEGWTLRGVNPAAAGEDLVRLAADLGGRAEHLATEPPAWRLTVERGRFGELAAALRALGVSGADPAVPVPPGAPCADVRVTIVP